MSRWGTCVEGSLPGVPLGFALGNLLERGKFHAGAELRTSVRDKDMPLRCGLEGWDVCRVRKVHVAPRVHHPLHAACSQGFTAHLNMLFCHVGKINMILGDLSVPSWKKNWYADTICFQPVRPGQH